jgi:hypothetical protein
MRSLLLIVCLALPALGQPLPLTWPARPDGLVLDVTDAITYDGAGVAGGPGEMIIARCDARDGDGRVVLQKISSQDPDGPGLWHTDLGEWGTVDGLFLPHASGTPLTPWVVADGEGGAIAVWQDVVDGETSILRACRVGDGPGGTGQPLWPAPVTVSEDVSTEIDDCRDASDRCRSVQYDRIKAACADGAGGAWIAWRTGQSDLRLQHILDDGSVDADLPAEGLTIGTWVHSFSLAADGLGSAVLCWIDALTWTVQTQGVRQDGSLARPEGPLQLTQPENQSYTFSTVTVGGGQVLAAWLSYENPAFVLRAQLLDAQLAPQFAAPGLLVCPNAYGGLLLSCAGTADPVYLVWNADGGSDPMAQRLGLDGSLAWGAGVSLSLVEGATQVVASAVTASGDGLACLLRGTAADGSGLLCLQRLDAQGQPVWNAAQALVGAITDAWSAALVPDGAEGLIGAWRDWSTSRITVNALHRDAGAQDLIDEAERVLAQSATGYPLNLCLVAEAEPPLAFWNAGTEIRMQAVDRAAGTPLLGAGGAVLPHPSLQSECSACSDGQGGACVLLLENIAGGWSGQELQLAHVTAGGTLLDPGAPLAPGIGEIDNISAIGNLTTARGSGRTFAAWRLVADDKRLYVQSMDDQGQRQWGDLGREIWHAGGNVDLRIVQLQPDGAGGVYVLYDRGVNWESSGLLLQRLDAQGEPLFTDNQGAGVLLGDGFQMGLDRARLLTLPDGGAALAWTSTMPARILHLAALHADGSLAWSAVPTSNYTSCFSLEQTTEGLLSLAYTEYLSPDDFLRLRHYGTDGDVVAAWGQPLEVWGCLDVVQQRGGAAGLVLVRDLGDPFGDAFGLQGLTPTAEGEFALVYSGMPTASPRLTGPALLSCDAAGGAWHALWDYSTGLVGYGGQLRLLRLDGMGGIVAPPTVDLEITLLGNAQARLSWSAVPSATSYDVYSAASLDAPFTYLANTTGTSWMVTTGAAQARFFRVVSRNDAMPNR